MEIVFAGFGGQGVLTAGLIVSEMALEEGKNVTWMPAYGPTMRGGKAYSVVKYSDDEIGCPDMEDIDILVAMNEPSLEYTSFLKAGGTVIVNTDNIPEDIEIDSKYHVVKLPCLEMALNVNNNKGATIVAIGAMIHKCELFSCDLSKKVLYEIFASKGKEKYAAGNEAALMAGWNAV